MTAPRRREKIGQRRRIEDEGDDDIHDIDDESMSEGSLVTEDNDERDDSDTSNVEEASPTAPPHTRAANGDAKQGSNRQQQTQPESDKEKQPVTDTDMMLHGLANTQHPVPAQEINFEDLTAPVVKSPTGPVIVSSASASRPQVPNLADRRRQEHEDYRRKRDEDPAFVPNRGSFFMHDHRHAGPAANGFRPFGRGRGRGGGGGGGGGRGGGFGDSFFAMNTVRQPADPTTNSAWTHDMHDMVSAPTNRRGRGGHDFRGPSFREASIPRRPENSEPINRVMSTERLIGNLQVRIFLPQMDAGSLTTGMLIKQYTRLPEHRPPLRSDKPVRISLPNLSPRYVFPAKDRSFTFIPRAMRPNQQRTRAKPRSGPGMGSYGGFSRRTSVFGGSIYGSMYSPSVAMSRRSSIHDRDYMFSPTGSVLSRPPPPADVARPVVKLPPAAPAGQQNELPQMSSATADAMNSLGPQPLPETAAPMPLLPQGQQPLDPLAPQHHSQPPANPTLYQPRPQKNISVANIESPAANAQSTGTGQAMQGAFHHQVPPHMANGLSAPHSRQPSFSQHSNGTPLSQIPERAIHAASFQPSTYGQQPYYGHPASFPSQPPQGNYYYGPNFTPMDSSMNQAVNVPPYSSPHHHVVPGTDPSTAVGGAAAAPGTNLVAQQMNGMVYYYDTAQMPPVNPYQHFAAPQGYQPGSMPMGSMAGGPPDANYYYGQPPGGTTYYAQ